jgi:hypothetical protein
VTLLDTREPATLPHGLPALSPATPVLATGDVRGQRSSALVLAEALRHAEALQLKDGTPIPGPTAIGMDAVGRIEIVMPDVASVLAWQPLLRTPRILDVNPWSITVSGTREGWDWIVRTAALR